MKNIEKIFSIIANFVHYPKRTIEELKKQSVCLGIKSMPYICAGLVGVLITLCGFRKIQDNMIYKPYDIYEPVIEEVVTPTPEPTSTPETREQYNVRMEAEYCAKVLYGTAQYNSEAGQKLVVWCIINRTESEKYPNSIKEVCQQKSQWMGYSDSNPIIQSLYDISLEVLQQWHNGGYRDVSPSFIYMTWTSDEIILKDRFEDNSKTHYWYE